MRQATALRFAHRVSSGATGCNALQLTTVDGSNPALIQRKRRTAHEHDQVQDEPRNFPRHGYRNRREGPRRNRARPVEGTRGHLHPVPSDTQFSLERHRADVQHPASHVRGPVPRAGHRGGPDCGAHSCTRVSRAGNVWGIRPSGLDQGGGRSAGRRRDDPHSGEEPGSRRTHRSRSLSSGRKSRR